MITAWLDSPIDQRIEYVFSRAEKVLASGTRRVPAWRSRLTLRDRSQRGGALKYQLAIKPVDHEDQVPENNRAKVLVGVEGPRPILCVTESQPAPLADLLRAGGLDVVEKRPKACDWSLKSLAGHSAVLIENVRADKIKKASMENMVAWVTQTGRGLMITGGKQSYGPGGYGIWADLPRQSQE